MKANERHKVLVCIIAIVSGLPHLAWAQSGIRMRGNWAEPSENGAAHRHIITRLKCPESLVGNYALLHGHEYAANNVSCTYFVPNSANLLSVYYYPAADSQTNELNTIGRPILTEKSAGGEIVQTAPSVIFGNIASQAIRLEATQAGSNLYNAITLLDRDGFRLKIRQTYQDNATAIEAAAAEFAALQIEAVENRAACAAMLAAPNRRARLADGAVVALYGGVLSAASFEPLSANPTNAPRPNACTLVLTRGSSQNLVLRYRADDRYLSVEPEASNGTPLVEMLKTDMKGAERASGFSVMLIGVNGAGHHTYRGYITAPSFEQSIEDMTAALNGTLHPLGTTSKQSSGEVSIAINSQEIEAEDKGLRNTPRQ
ncbi:MAG: hypothetical protein FD163_1831 [Hyphomonadaceae bacterium]|nr:MAG: hypothetical protein FD128_550 [Hyphomonadaceae bacterium]KAF0184257.1 MAG: hypothetical protein FD163_1831 [Hyphomonadaceae bacterium]